MQVRKESRARNCGGGEKSQQEVGDLDSVIDNCAKEPIHLIDMIQSHGALLAIRVESGKIAIASDNAHTLLASFIKRSAAASVTNGNNASLLLGRAYKEVLMSGALRKMIKIYLRNGYEDLQVGTIAKQSAKKLQQGIFVNHQDASLSLDVALHRSGRFLVVEFVRVPRGEFVDLKLLQSMLTSLDEFTDFGSSSDALVHKMKDISGFDRVLVYKFDEDYNGIVIAEATEDHLDSLMGHHFPASDIPAQARALLLKNPIRAWTRNPSGTPPSVLLYDGDDPIDTSHSPADHSDDPSDHRDHGQDHSDGKKLLKANQKQQVHYYQRLEQGLRVLDMSYCLLRAYSPVHVQYLANMGVAATVSFAITAEGGRLWGIIACHHMSKKVFSFSRLKAVQLLALLYAQKLVHSEAEQMISVGFHLNRNLKSILTKSQAFSDPSAWIFQNAQGFMELFSAHGVAVNLPDIGAAGGPRRGGGESDDSQDAKNSPRAIWTCGTTLADDMIRDIARQFVMEQQRLLATPHAGAASDIGTTSSSESAALAGTNSSSSLAPGDAADGQQQDLGAPTQAAPLVRDGRGQLKVFATHRLSEFHPPAASCTKVASGILVIPLHNEHSFIMLFRPCVDTKVVWAGKPEKETTVHNGRTVLNPRSSFKAWEQLMSNRSQPWDDQLLNEAKFLREFLLERIHQFVSGPGADEAWRTAVFLNFRKLANFFSSIFTRWTTERAKADKPTTASGGLSMRRRHSVSSAPGERAHRGSMIGGKVRIRTFVEDLLMLPNQEFHDRLAADFRNIAVCLQVPQLNTESAVALGTAYLCYAGVQGVLPDVVQWAIEIEFGQVATSGSNKKKQQASLKAFGEAKSTGALLMSALLQASPSIEYLSHILQPLKRLLETDDTDDEFDNDDDLTETSSTDGDGDGEDVVGTGSGEHRETEHRAKASPEEEKLLQITQSILERIYRVNSCPVYIREMLFLVYIHMCRLVGDTMTSPSTRLVAVSSLFFVRFVCLAITSPERIGLAESDLLAPHRKALHFISQALQKVLCFVLAETSTPPSAEATTADPLASTPSSASPTSAEIKGKGLVDLFGTDNSELDYESYIADYSLPVEFIRNNIYPLRGFLRNVVDSESIKAARDDASEQRAKSAQRNWIAKAQQAMEVLIDSKAIAVADVTKDLAKDIAQPWSSSPGGALRPFDTFVIAATNTFDQVGSPDDASDDASSNSVAQLMTLRATRQLRKQLGDLAQLVDPKLAIKAPNFTKRCCWKPYFH